MDLLENITLFVNGEKHTVDASTVTPFTTLNAYLRDNLQLTGTKNMCLEGGCGACIVTASRINPLSGQQETFAINSCLTSIFSCYGWNIETIEGMGNSKMPHKLQNTLAKFNGSQCGFCSPGMIMNMHALEKSRGKLTMKDVENSFGGNICRCTGYRPILAAFKSTCEDAPEELVSKYPDIEDTNSCSVNCGINCAFKVRKPFYFKMENMTWISVTKFADLLQVLRTFHSSNIVYKLVAGNTAKGVYKSNFEPEVYIDILNVPELVQHDLTKNKVSKLTIGANTSLTNAMDLFYKTSREDIKFNYLRKLADHMDLIANVPVRNTGTIAGNLMIKHQHPEFPSDIFLVLETVSAKISIVDINNKEYILKPSEFLKLNMDDKIIKKIHLTALEEHYFYESYKIMPRAQNAHALVNAGFLFKINKVNIIDEATICYGCINPNFVHSARTEKYLIGKNVFDNNILQNTFEMLDKELNPNFELPDPQPEFRKKLAISLFYKYILSIAPQNLVDKKYKRGGEKLLRPVSQGSQEYGTDKSLYPVSKPIKKIEALFQTTGEAKYIMDSPDLPNQLYSAFVLSKAPPNSIITDINADEALKLDGVVAFFDKTDIPGKNTFTPKAGMSFSVEEELFCSEVIKYYSQPVGIVVAVSNDIAQKAADLVKVMYRKCKEKPNLTVREVLEKKDDTKIKQNNIIAATNRGDKKDYFFKGTFDLKMQYHYHMELQCCNVVPNEDSLDMYPSSQWMDLSQNAAAIALNIPANKINVSVKRLGGAFGAKIVRNSMVSTAAALAAYKLKKPIKLSLPMETNMRVIGKRYPVTGDYEVALDNEGVIQYLDSKVYYDHGAGDNEPIIVLFFESFLETYNSDSWSVDGKIVYTDTHASCYTRAPGSAEGMAMCEAIMEHCAMVCGKDSLEFRMLNLNKKYPILVKHINELKTWAEIDKRKAEIKEFNTANRWKKRAISVIPMVFPFHLIFNYGVIVSIYHLDGSVAVSHGGVEVGQGINTKVTQVCAYKLGIPLDKISIKASNNLVAPNSNMTGASITSEGVCWGVMKACDILLQRMKAIKEKMGEPTWTDLVKNCHEEYVDLCATYMFSPNAPDLQNYKIYGVCASEIELDALTGQHQILRVDLLEDVGNSMSPEIDIGQVEGAFVMGLGYFTSEEIIFSDNGEILTNRTWNYKPPGAKDIPIDFRVKFPKDNYNPVGVLKSKATGEPPLCLAVSVPLAIRNAVAEIRSENDKSIPKWYPINGPSTVENTLTNCLLDYRHFKL